jgi:hypothetical protein
MKDTTNSKDVCELFVEGSHHRNISVACIFQTGFSTRKVLILFLLCLNRASFLENSISHSRQVACITMSLIKTRQTPLKVYALLRHKRNRIRTTQPYPQSSDVYPPSSQAYPPPPPPEVVERVQVN